MISIHKPKVIKILSLLTSCISFQIAVAGGGLILPDMQGFYIGGSVGKGTLEPSTQNTGWKVDDSSSNGYKIYAGYEITPRWGAELFYADLGSAHLNGLTASLPNGSIDYKLTGLGAVYKLPSKGRFNPIFKVGIANVKNKSSKINYIQNNDTVTFAGIGAEYRLTTHWNLRTEYEYFDKDIQFLSIGVKWQ